MAITIRQIAERAGVSTATVSNVIHGKIHKVSSDTVRRVRRIMDEMGYQQEIGNRVSRDTKLVAVLIHYNYWFENSVLADPFYGVVTGSMEEALRRHDTGMLLYASRNIEEILLALRKWDVDGMIAVSFSCEDCGKLYHLMRKPMISIDATGEIPNPVPNIGLDDEGGGFLMLQHLLELGYEHIYMAGGANDGIDHRRWIGAKQIRSTSLFLERRAKLEFLPLGFSRDVRENRYREIVRQVPFKRKTAFFFTADSLAMEAMGIFAAWGIRIPQDAGVAGFDNSFNAVHFSIPPLTTIHQDIREKGRIAVEELVSALQNPDYIPRSHILPVSLVKRQSV